MFWETLWALVLGFGLSGAVQAFVTRGQMERVLGRRTPGSIAKATALGAASSSCSYAAAAMGKSLFQKGADFVAAMVFMVASTNLVVELGIVLALLIGWQFTASEFVGGAVMIAVFALVARVAFPDRIVEAARARLQGAAAGEVGEHDQHGAGAEAGAPFRQRVRSLAEWSDAASYAIADVTMLRREMVIGFTIAGFLAVLVPDSAWSVIFLSGHGFWSSLENVIIGPLIAIISFVCSIGNVPLAAALWKGGISFGGVVSFIFADLITLPLLLIYRKYYGWNLTLRLAGAFWFVMSLGGLIVEGLFSALHLVPTTRPTEIAPTSFRWDYTTILDLVAIAAFAGLYWLYRNRERLGGGARYALDPVCGMQVEKTSCPARARHQGTVYYFCADRCHDRFTADPERYAKLPATAMGGGSTSQPGGTGTAGPADPVCGMGVTPESAAAHRVHQGLDYWFCSAGCAEQFDPSRHTDAVSALSRSDHDGRSKGG